MFAMNSKDSLMNARVIALIALISALLAVTMVGCGDDITDPSVEGDTSETQDGTQADECTEETVSDDCPDITIGVWTPTCDGDVLQTPTGTGEMRCIDGACDKDFEVVESDCAAEGKTCGPNTEPDAQGDVCL
jgi:hypothetical protein